MVSGEGDGIFDEEQYTANNLLVEKWGRIQQRTLKFY